MGDPLKAYHIFFYELTNVYRLFIPLYDSLPLQSNKDYKWCKDTLDALITDLMNKSRAKAPEERNSLLDFLIDSGEDTKGLTTKELHDNIMVLFLAGHGMFLHYF